VGTFVQLTEVA